jgi:CRISPR-associated Csx14 family protein
MANVLIATLGDWPIVVTAMFRLLHKKEGIGAIEKVVVLHPKEGPREKGYWMIETALQSECEVESHELPFEDVYSEHDSYRFLHELFQRLYAHKQSGDAVYLSLAGGRKNMSALMALVAPFYSCVKQLYHMLDREEYGTRKNFRTVEELWSRGESAWQSALEPDMESLQLVEIPFDDALRVSDIYLERLLKRTPEELQALWENNPSEADREQFFITLLRPHTTDTILDMFLTTDALDDYEEIREHNTNLARDFKECFRYMRFATHLEDHNRRHGTIPGAIHGKSYPFHYYKRHHTKERPFFHTEPGDIANYPNTENKVDRVIISGLAVHKGPGPDYVPSRAKLLARTADDPQKWHSIYEILSEEDRKDSILIVPLGIAPMVATQLYTLLTKQKRTIHEVVLVYPGQANQILDGVELLEKAFKHEGIDYQTVPVPELEDIASTKDCKTYQAKLEDTILEMQADYPNWEIDLALSGGRKGMAALAIFAAQRTRLPYVYHTLITNKTLDQQVESETTLEELGRLSIREYCDLLFLRTYKKQEAHFVVFKVPVGPMLGE